MIVRKKGREKVRRDRERKKGRKKRSQGKLWKICFAKEGVF